MALTARNNRRFSPWVLVIVAVITVVLFGAGGGLISVFDSCLLDPYTSVCNYGYYNAGLAFISLGSLTSLALVALFILFLVSRRPTPVQYNHATGNFAPVHAVPQPQAQPQQYYSTQPQQTYGAQPQQQFGAQVQYPAPVVPNKETYVTVQPVQQSAPAPPYPVQELEAPLQSNDKRCGRCEAVVHSAFCQRCGSSVETV
jgi:hypothetical protein